MSPEIRKITIDKVCGKISNLFFNLLKGLIEHQIKKEALGYLNRKKAEGKIPPKVFLKVTTQTNVFYCDPDIPGPDGVEERAGQPHIITII